MTHENPGGVTHLRNVALRLALAREQHVAALRARRNNYRSFDVRTGRYTLQDVKRMVHEPTPWLYDYSDPRYARDWPYTLLIYRGGFMQRIYDWQGRPVRVAA